ncbi:MAG TPA: hypothetical protein PLZ95_03580 [Bryobacteraceae bacterium]|mgnify:CR=1 FL=1|nr:hypothetical protein [Bryobacteraceae bacterium]
MTRRHAILLFLPATIVRAEDRLSVAGHLKPAPDGRVSLLTTGDRTIELAGDRSTMAVLHDPRVIREDFLALGEWKSKDAFQIDPIHKKALFVRRKRELLVITYWCEVCAIRTYAPGRCQCCQEETAFDPRDPSLDNNSL